jgi:hypothetical protein
MRRTARVLDREDFPGDPGALRPPKAPVPPPSGWE